MKNISFFIGFMLCFSLICKAQTTISGHVIIEDTINIEEKRIVVINQTTNKRTLVDKEGFFSIEVNLNDVIEVKSAFTVPRKLRITDNILTKRWITIELDIETIELKEVQLNPLKPNLKENVSKEKTQQEKIYESIGFNQEFKLDMIKYGLALDYVKKYGGNTRFENVIKLKDDFTNEAKTHRPEVRKDKERNIRMEQILLIKEFFTANYFTEYLKLPEEKIIDFISYCYDKHEFKELVIQQKFDDIFYFFEEEVLVFNQLIQPKK